MTPVSSAPPTRNISDAAIERMILIVAFLKLRTLKKRPCKRAERTDRNQRLARTTEPLMRGAESGGVSGQARHVDQDGDHYPRRDEACRIETGLDWEHGAERALLPGQPADVSLCRSGRGDGDGRPIPKTPAGTEISVRSAGQSRP